jgi:hypothetical protein
VIFDLVEANSEDLLTISAATRTDPSRKTSIGQTRAVVDLIPTARGCMSVQFVEVPRRTIMDGPYLYLRLLRETSASRRSAGIAR